MPDSVVLAQGKKPLVLGVVGWSGSGKTHLIGRLLPVMAERGWVVSVIKHSHHDIVLDVPGKDSDCHRRAGAREVMVVSPWRWGLFAETEKPLTLKQQLARLAPADLVLIEGQKQLDLPKIEVYRPECGHAPRYLQDRQVIAVASLHPLPDGGRDVPWLPLDDTEGIAAFVGQLLSQSRPACFQENP